jgi:hypothetical protein
MMSKQKNKKTVRHKHRPFFRLILWVARKIKSKPTIFNHNGMLVTQAIFISNHSAAAGPLVLSLFFPSFFIPWGAHMMRGKYKSRWNYLYHVFYRQKLGYSKIRSWLLASSFAIVSGLIYKGMNLIPVYNDARLLKTFKLSEKAIKKEQPVFIFPEDSDTGYLEFLTRINYGFAAFSEYYHEKNKVDLPIYPIYFYKKRNAMIIGKPKHLQPLINEGKSREQIADIFREEINQLGKEMFSLLDGSVS